MITKTKAQGWGTPFALFAQLHAEYAFTVDAAASIGNHLLPRYWTPAHGPRGALGKSLDGERAFVNPPFGLLFDFLSWSYENRARGFSYVLCPANIETDWFHQLAVHAEKETFFRRVPYRAPAGVAQSAPSFPSIACKFGPTCKASGLGFALRRDARTGLVIPLEVAP